MFPQLGGGEHWLVVAVILLLVVRPKDLPKTLREIGRWIGKVRAMANEFKASFEDMARQSELDELRAEVEAMRAGAAQTISDTQAALEASQVQVDAMVNGEVPYQPEPEPETPAIVPAAEKPKRARKPKTPAAETSIAGPSAESGPAPKPAPRRKPPAKAKS